MKPPPPGWPRISSSANYEEPAKAIDWLCKAFGFEVKIKVEGENGYIEHSELTLGEGLIMVGSAKAKPGRPDPAYRKSPRSLGGANTQSMMAYVDDVEAHCKNARAHGATVVSELATQDYGPGYWVDRGYEAVDLEGHHWWFVQRIKTDTPKG